MLGLQPWKPEITRILALFIRSGRGTGTAESTWALSPRLGRTAVTAATVIFLAFMLLRTWVRYKIPDPAPYRSFPDACPSWRLNGCNRVAEHEPHNNR